jgi:hypothetical protein
VTAIGGSRRVAAGLIFVLMLLGGLFMWAGSPYLWLRVTAANADSQNLSMGQVLFILVAIGVTGFVMVKILAWLNSVYTRVTGGEDEVVIRMPWTQSMRDGRTTGRVTTILDVVMVISVSLALLAAAVWFFFFAGDTLHHGQKRSSAPAVTVVASAPSAPAPPAVRIGAAR